MMRKAIIIVAALGLAAAAYAVQAPTWARVYYDSAAAMERDILAAGMDVCSGGEGYVDVIAPAEELAGLQELGYRIEVIAEDAGAGIAALPPDLGLYHTYQEMLDELKQRETAYPSICKLYDVGDTWESREMWCLKVSDNPAQSEQEPRLFVVGNHHARELMTVEIPLRFIKVLLEGYATNPDIKYYVDNYEIYFMPMANPDGHVYVENNSGGSPSYWWRKNRRDSGGGVYGVDINRNYSYKWGYDDRGSSPNPSSTTYRGPAAFSEPETTAIRNLMKDVDFKFALDYHSYGEYLLIPYCYDTLERAPNPERNYFLEIGNGMNTKLGSRYLVGTSLETLRYPVNGGSIDYHFGETAEKNKIYGWCFEVNTRTEGGFGPPDTLIEPTCKEHEGVFMWFLDYMRKFVGVELAGFDGYAREGRAVLTWATAGEYNHAGFNLYRDAAGAGDEGRVKINDALIVGKSPYRFVDDVVEAGKSYNYYLEDVDLNGKGTLHGPARVDMQSGAKASFALAQNAPNPARAATTIAFSVPAACDAKVAVYDIAGRKVATPFAGQAKAGENELAVDVSTLAPGVYTYRLEAGGATAAKRMVVVR
ncbi:MAG TPA: M14 family zinc carboxypeptidase [bacterium]|nr:M14 family zinc carboxypeptidase [bacterium]